MPIIHTTDKAYPVISGDILPDTVLAVIISNEIAKSNCNAVINPPFSLIRNGIEIGSSKRGLKNAHFQDFGVLASLGTSEDPLNDPFHCKPQVTFARLTAFTLIQNGAGYLAGLSCLIHIDFGTNGRFTMQLWKRIPSEAGRVKDGPLADLVRLLFHNNAVTGDCFAECNPSAQEISNGYQEISVDTVIRAFASASVDGVGFFPADTRAGSAVDSSSCPADYCGSLKRANDYRRSSTPIYKK